MDLDSFLLPHGSIHQSIGGRFRYKILGPCCNLYDREDLPWPCCRLSWRGKEPFWNRIGRRLVPDFASRKCASYSVEIIDPDCSGAQFVWTLFPFPLAREAREWWYSKRKPLSQAE